MDNIVLGKHNRYIKICNLQGLIPEAHFPIYGVSDPEDPISNTVIFVKKTFNESIPVKECIILSKSAVNVDSSNIQIISDKPKNAYADVLHSILNNLSASVHNGDNEANSGANENDDEANVADVANVDNVDNDYFLTTKAGSFISKRAHIGNNTKIGKFCVIEDDVYIGKGCSIADYTHIGAHTSIGNNVVIKERCSIGISDADIYRDSEDNCLTLPHLGGTIIEDGCLLLNDAHVAAGDTRATVICKGSMVGIDANVGHNSFIGRNTLIGAYACVCGHCNVGESVYIAPSSTIMNRLHIGNNSKIGLGAVVLSDVKDNDSVFGNPAMAYWNKKG